MNRRNGSGFEWLPYLIVMFWLRTGFFRLNKGNMGVEAVGFEKASSTIEAENKYISHDKENGKPDEQIKFGSQENGLVKGEVSNVSDANFPKDAADEWPEHKIHQFYFVRCRPLDDPKIRAKMDHADKEIARWNQARFKTIEKLRAKRVERGEVISQLKPLDAENKQFNIMVDEKRREMEPLQQALGKLRTANTAGRGSGLCSSEEELNEVIQSLNYRIQHESISLAEEKQILREIKQLEGTRDKVIENAAMRAKLQDSLGQKEVIQDQVKLMGVDLDGVRKDQQAVKARIKNLRDELERIDADIKSLQDELTEVTEKKDRAYENMQELRKLRDEGNTLFFENRTLLNKVRDLAAKKDVKGIQELSHIEVEKFMSSWSGSKSFRNDYEKRLLQSLDGRQMSKDARTRNPSEKPLVAVENPTPPETEVVVKVNAKKIEETKSGAPQMEPAPSQKAQKAVTKKAVEPEIASDVVGSVAKEDAGSKKSAKEPEVESQINAEKLKEMKREEQIAKAKQAMDRKKKLAEKNAAKAALKAQKEAEKKLKEREKKLKKKAAASAPATDLDEQAEEATEQELDPASEAPDSEKEKVREKKTTVRPRVRSRGSESIPKVFPKRKKSTNYWVWAAPAAVALVLLLVALGYQYFA